MNNLSVVIVALIKSSVSLCHPFSLSFYLLHYPVVRGIRNTHFAYLKYG